MAGASVAPEGPRFKLSPRTFGYVLVRPVLATSAQRLWPLRNALQQNNDIDGSNWRLCNFITTLKNCQLHQHVRRAPRHKWNARFVRFVAI